MLKVSLENQLDSDAEPSNLLVPKANDHVVESLTIEKTFEEGSSKAEKEVKEKRKEKDKGKEKGKWKGKINKKRKLNLV